MVELEQKVVELEQKVVELELKIVELERKEVELEQELESHYWFVKLDFGNEILSD